MTCGNFSIKCAVFVRVRLLRDYVDHANWRGQIDTPTT